MRCNSTFELRQAPFLWGFTWIHDLAKPDRLIRFPARRSAPLFGWHVAALNMLPILLAVVFYLQQKFTPKPPATTPEQEQQQKMMQWMIAAVPAVAVQRAERLEPVHPDQHARSASSRAR